MIALCLMIRKVKLNLQINRGEHSVCQNTSSKKNKSAVKQRILNRSDCRVSMRGRRDSGCQPLRR